VTIIYRRAQRRRFIRRIAVVVGSLWLQIDISRLADNASTKLFVSQLMPKLPMLSKNSTAEQAIARAEKGRQGFDVALPLGTLAAGFAFLRLLTKPFRASRSARMGALDEHSAFRKSNSGKSAKTHRTPRSKKLCIVYLAKKYAYLIIQKLQQLIL
jgi:hypothetical protein